MEETYTEKIIIVTYLASLFGETEKFKEHLKETKLLDGLYAGINIKTRELIILHLN